MNVKVIFNTNKKLKDAAMKKARKQGVTLSAVLNLATQAYVNDKMEIDFFFAQDIAVSREQIKQGKVVPLEEVRKRLGLK